jgi:hypothetical protein
MIGRSWRTTFIGALTFLAGAIPQAIGAYEGQAINWPIVALSVGAGLMGWLAKDAGVTGSVK